MQATYATNDIPAQQRRQYWQQVVSDIYFSLDLRFLGGHDFNGSLGA